MVQLMPLHPKTQSSLASFISRLVLPFWYRLTQVVLEKRPLYGCSVVVVILLHRLNNLILPPVYSLEVRLQDTPAIVVDSQMPYNAGVLGGTFVGFIGGAKI